jgi:KaiC/GvpD/RAD55 family RecA-like ATPase
MKPDQEILAYIQRKKWEYSDRNPTQYNLKKCPVCGDKKNHFYMNKTTGQYICWKCEAEGNLYTLKKQLGDVAHIETLTPARPKLDKDEYNRLRRKVNGWHNALKANKEVRKRVKEEWGYGKVAVKRFKLGLRKRGKINWLVIPQYENKKLANVKYRSIPPASKQFLRQEGMESVLYNTDRVDPEINSCVLFEGESDTITADCYLNVDNAIGVTVGARGFKEDWIDYLAQFEKIYICYDPDLAGQKGARKIAFRLGIHKCYNVEVPVKDGVKKTDLNGWYLDGNGEEDFKTLLDQATPFDIQDVSSLSTVLDDLESELHFSKRLDQHGFLTPWDNVNRLLGSFVAGDLVVVSGQAKIGKSTFALNVLLHHAQLGVPVMDYCLEMRPERIGAKVVSYFRGIQRDHITTEDVIYVKTIFGRKPFYMAHSYSFTTEQVYDTIREAVKRYGIELLVFDHLHFLIRATEGVSHHVSAAVRDFKLIAEELRIPILLICQPRKSQSKNARMTTDDLRDSSAIGQDADTVIIIHRNRLPEQRERESNTNQPLFDSTAEIIVDATRYNPGGMTKLLYNGAISRYFVDGGDERRFYDGD